MAAARRHGFYGGEVFRSFAALLIILPVLVTLSLVYPSPSSNHGNGANSLSTSSFAVARVLDDSKSDQQPLITSSSQTLSLVNDSLKHVEFPKDDDLLGGLLPSGFDKRSCLSRYQSFLYRRASPYKPSDYLLRRLRKYEEMHRHCGPNTSSYADALKQLKSGHAIAASRNDCSYIVWISFSGLGNRILTIASAFLYALLTNRVLLIDPGADMTDLFCEPFPNASWFLSDEDDEDFPLKDQFKTFDQKTRWNHGYMLRNGLLNASADSVPSYLYVHMIHNYDDYDKLFFCEREQAPLARVPWLILRTDNYFVPSLFLIPSFEQELASLFPQRVALFHHLGRYLFHPTNQVWGLIVRFYNAYLAKADERIGVQIRIFEDGDGPFPHVKDQIVSCLLKEKLLPGVNRQDPFAASTPDETRRSIAVLTTSLISGYYEMLREMYWEHPTVTGEVIGVYQPSHEEFQQSEKIMHNRKAWAEMYLLSLSDKLVTSAWSTFGYVAQGLGGLRPWILYKAENKTRPDPPCGQAVSIEPCFHAPPFWDCKTRRGADTGRLVPHVRHCEDVSWGLKLFDAHS